MAGFIVNPGGPSDREALPLCTRKRTRIPNEMRMRQPPARMRAAYEIVRKQFPASRVLLRALDASYNCVGLVFASRRTCIDPEHVEMILREDEYERRPSIDAAEVGDVAVYRDDQNQPCHVGLVAEVQPDLAAGGPSRIRILSQWGSDGEYLHDADAVHPQLGRLTEIWTYRYGVSR